MIDASTTKSFRRAVHRLLVWRQRTRLFWWGRLATRIGGVWDCGPASMVIHRKGLTLTWGSRILWRGEIKLPAPWPDERARR